MKPTHAYLRARKHYRRQAFEGLWAEGHNEHTTPQGSAALDRQLRRHLAITESAGFVGFCAGRLMRQRLEAYDRKEELKRSALDSTAPVLFIDTEVLDDGTWGRWVVWAIRYPGCQAASYSLSEAKAAVVAMVEAVRESRRMSSSGTKA